MLIFWSFLLLPVGFALLVWGAKLLCDSSLSISKNFKIDSPVLSVFLVSLGTAAPDCASELISIIRGHPDMSVGGILGCNFANLTLGLGIASIIAPFKCSKDMANLELPLLAILDTLFVSFCLSGKLVRIEGIIFLIALIGYVYYSFFRRKGGMSNIKKASFHQETHWSTKRSIFIFIASALMLAYGAYVVVEACTAISDWLGVSKTFIGFSLLALGNSAPEIFVVSTATLRKQHAICAGNIICSNFINLTFVTGMCALIKPFHFDNKTFVIEAISAVSMSYITWYIFKTREWFSRTFGSLYVFAYIAVMAIIVIFGKMPR